MARGNEPNASRVVPSCESAAHNTLRRLGSCGSRGVFPSGENAPVERLWPVFALLTLAAWQHRGACRPSGGVFRDMSALACSVQVMHVVMLSESLVLSWTSPFSTSSSNSSPVCRCSHVSSASRPQVRHNSWTMGGVVFVHRCLSRVWLKLTCSVTASALPFGFQHMAEILLPGVDVHSRCILRRLMLSWWSLQTIARRSMLGHQLAKRTSLVKPLSSKGVNDIPFFIESHYSTYIAMNSFYIAVSDFQGY